MIEGAKPCPFCDADELVWETVTAGEDQGEHFVRCQVCWASGTSWGTKKEALKIWNTRAGVPDLEVLRNAVRKALYEWENCNACTMNAVSLCQAMSALDETIDTPPHDESEGGSDSALD